MRNSMVAPASDRGFRGGAGAQFPKVETSGCPLIIGGYVKRGSTMEGDELVTFTTDVTQAGSIIGKAGDKWLHVIMVGPHQVDGWVAQRHMGLDCCALTDNGAPPPEPTVQVDLTFVSASPITIIANGVPVGTWTGTITLVANG